MSSETVQARITKKTIVYKIPGMDDVIIRRDVEYRQERGVPLGMDIYRPAKSKSGGRTSAVIFVTGYPDPGFEKIFGCQQKDMESYISWAKLVAASGLVAITYANAAPATDVEALLQFVRRNASMLEIDENRIGVWACSGNVPNALSILMRESRDFLKCAVLLYGFMLDFEGSTVVADAANQWGFVNPTAGKSVDDLTRELPLFIAKAGRDETPGLNETIDRFMIKALARNLPISFVNHAEAPHAFDLSHDSETSREIISQILAFFRFHLAGRLLFQLGDQ